MIGLILDERLSPKIAEGLRELRLPVPVHSMNEWKDGTFRGRPDPQSFLNQPRTQIARRTPHRGPVPVPCTLSPVPCTLL